MRSFWYYGMAAVVAAAFGRFSAQEVIADEMKAAPPIEVKAGSASQMHNAAGIDHFNQGHFDIAAKHFAEAVQADEKSGEAHYNHALALDKLGQHKEATAEFDQALKLAPNNPAVADSPILKSHLARMKK